MMNRLHLLARRTAALLGAGMLLQAGGSNNDTNAIFSGLVTSVAYSLISSIVFGAFIVVGV